MTSAELRDTLEAVAHAVEVPTVDRVAFQARVRQERRRRTSRRTAIGAVAVAAAVVAGIALVPHGSMPAPVRPTKPAPDPAVAVQGQWFIPVLLDHRVTVLTGDGSGFAKHLPATEMVGIGAGRVVYLDRDRHLVVLPLKKTGEPKTPVDWSGPDAVADAVVSGDGEQLAYRNPDGSLHLRETGKGVETAAEGSQHGRLVATDGSSFLTLAGGTLSLSGAGDTVAFQDADPATGGQVAGDTVAYETASGVQLFDVDGTKRYGDLGAARGSLSPDGLHYATAPDEAQRNTERIAPTLRVVDTHTGSTVTIAGWDTDQQVQSFWWQSSDRFVVLTTDPEHEPGNRLLWTCSLALDSCGQVYDDPGHTLELPGQ